jgi:signal transduction histidine kinase
MPDDDALRKAQTLLNELTEAARKGAIIPVRLPGQLEEIGALLENALTPSPSPSGRGEEDKAKSAEAATAADDPAEIRREQAVFVPHAVHELRTPMTSIRGYSDMLGTPGMGELSDMQKQFVDVIRTNAKRMEGLLTDVSDTAKIRGNTLKLAAKMDMFKNIAMKVEKAVQPTADQLGRKLTLDIPSGLPMLDIDGDMLAKALTKLVENSLRYTEAENPEIKMRGEADGSTLRIIVEDNGIGLSPEDLAQLGTIYFRSENELVRTYKGSGLGIPVAYGIIKLLGGSVDVKSELGKGTTFTVTLKGMS